MGKIERISGDIDADVYAEIAAAVERGDLESPEALVSALVNDWVMDRRGETPEEIARVRALIEESRRNPHPGYPMEEVFAELRARYADPENAE